MRIFLPDSQSCLMRWRFRALDVAGLLLGLWISTRWQRGRSWLLSLEERLRRKPFRGEIAVLAIGLVLWWSTGLLPVPRISPDGLEQRFSIDYWQRTRRAPTLVGEIKYAGIYGRALNQEQVRRLRKSLEDRGQREETSDLGLLVGYDFRRGRSAFIVPEGTLRWDGRLVLEGLGESESCIRMDAPLRKSLTCGPQRSIFPFKRTPPLSPDAHTLALYQENAGNTRYPVTDHLFAREICLRPRLNREDVHYVCEQLKNCARISQGSSKEA